MRRVPINLASSYRIVRALQESPVVPSMITGRTGTCQCVIFGKEEHPGESAAR